MIHAHLILAPSIEAAELAEDLLVPSIDVQHIVVSQLGIDDTRMLVELAAKQPIQFEHRSFVVCCSSITKEAQNALLKLFEEPPQQSIFYLIIPHESLLLPTLKSRFVRTVHPAVRAENANTAAFLNASYADRIAMVTDMQKAKNADGMAALATAVGATISKNIHQYPPEAVKEVLFVESHIRVKGASKKMLLEHLALSLPVRGS